MPVPTNPPSARTPKPTYIIGHKNPDADAICSALAYAAFKDCLLYTSPSPRDRQKSRMPSSA